MKSLSLIKNHRRIGVMIAAACFVTLSVFATGAMAQQQSQLNLADFLIGLRSKKVTLIDRNKLLTEAARTRGVTFALTPEIERELVSTGADKDLIAAIREKGTIVKTAAVISKPEPKAEPVAEAAPPPPDAAFYQRSGLSNLAKGEFDLAIVDYTKAIGMNPADAAGYLGRGRAYYSKKAFDQSVNDLNKAIELQPKDTAAYLYRGFAVEKLGHTEKALADYQKSFDLDASNESAKLNLRRLQDEQARSLAKAKQAEEAKPAPAPAKPVIPEFVDLGMLSSSDAVRMVNPSYSELARKAGIEGKVVVELSMDAEGNVTDAKVVSGSSFLRQTAVDAAKRSKFKPATVNGQAVKSIGTITYNFTRTGNE